VLIRYRHMLGSASNLPRHIDRLAKQARRNRRRLVLVTGVFDVLHAEHLALLEKARLQGDVLVVGVESDWRVRQLKGEGRPRHDQTSRVAALEVQGVADGVFVLPEQFSQPQDHLRLVSQLRPDVLAVSEQSPFLDNKRQIMAKIGGRVEVVHRHNPAVSTTKLLDRQR